jgi:hypothetical protein
VSGLNRLLLFARADLSLKGSLTNYCAQLKVTPHLTGSVPATFPNHDSGLGE